MSEDDYLALVTRLQQAMAIEPFHPSVIDVARLASEWRMLTTENERLRNAGLQLAADSATESAMKDAEIERLRQHDKEATDLTIDQQAEIGRLRAALEWVRDNTELWDAPVVLKALGDAGAQG
jgi:hypothetical protein